MEVRPNRHLWGLLLAHLSLNTATPLTLNLNKMQGIESGVQIPVVWENSVVHLSVSSNMV